MRMNSSILHRSCRNLLRTATVSRPVGVVHSQHRGHSRIVNVSRGYDKPTLFFNHQTQSPRIVSVHGKGTKTNGCSGGNIATVLARGKASVSHDSSHENELVRVQLNGFRDRLADIGSNVENRLADIRSHLGEFSNRISLSEKTNLLLFGAMGSAMLGLFGTMLGLFGKIDSTSKELNDKIDSTSKELNKKIDSTNNKIDALVTKIDQGNSRRLWPW